MHTSTTKPQTALAGALWRAAKRFLSPPAPTMQQQRVIRQLSSIDEYLLTDFGISRSDIPYLVIESGKSLARRRRVRG